MPLDRVAVDDASGKHIEQLQQLGYVPDKEKRKIRRMHEAIAHKVEHKKRKKR